jgi:hypothetical protein
VENQEIETVGYKVQHCWCFGSILVRVRGKGRNRLRETNIRALAQGRGQELNRIRQVSIDDLSQSWQDR